MDGERKELISREELLNEARKFCSPGECTAPFNCKRERGTEYRVPKLGNLKQCPLEKYEVDSADDQRTPEERILDDAIIKRRKGILLCAVCDHAECGHVDKQISSVLRKNDTDCLDCPVYKDIDFTENKSNALFQRITKELEKEKNNEKAMGKN